MWIVEALHYILFWGNMGQSDNYVAGNKESALQIALLVAVKRDGKKESWMKMKSRAIVTSGARRTEIGDGAAVHY